MSGKSEQFPAGENLRHALQWIAETMSLHPEKGKKDIVFEAECKFDLSPLECEILNQKLISIHATSSGCEG